MYFAEPLKDPNGFASRKLPFLPIAIQILVDISFMFKIFTVLAANCESIDNPENLVSLNWIKMILIFHGDEVWRTDHLSFLQGWIFSRFGDTGDGWNIHHARTGLAVVSSSGLGTSGTEVIGETEPDERYAWLTQAYTNNPSVDGCM